MNSTIIAADSMSPSTQKTEYSNKMASIDNRFEKALSEFMDTDGLDTAPQSKIDSVLANAELMLPTLDNLNELTSRLKYVMDLMFVRNDIPSDPPVELDYSYSDNQVVVKGDRDDLDEISRLINENPDMKEAVRTTLAIGSTVAAIKESYDFQQEYLASNDPEAVIRKYSYLFGDDKKYAHVTVSYGEDITVFADGKTLTV